MSHHRKTFSETSQIVLSSLPVGEFHGIFFNVGLDRARKALKGAGCASNDDEADSELERLVEHGWLTRRCKVGKARVELVWFHRPYVRSDFPREVDFVVARFRHELLTYRSHRIGFSSLKSLLVANDVSVSGGRNGGLLIDWCDVRYCRYLMSQGPIITSQTYKSILVEWGFPETTCPFLEACNVWNKSTHNSAALFAKYLKDRGAPSIYPSPGTTQTLRCASEDSCVPEKKDDYVVLEVHQHCEHEVFTSATSDTTSSDDGDLSEGNDECVRPMGGNRATLTTLTSVVINPERAHQEQQWLASLFGKAFVDDLVPLSAIGVLRAPAAAAPTAPCDDVELLPPGTTRWSLRAIRCDPRRQWGLSLLNAVNDERMHSDLTHECASHRRNSGGACDEVDHDSVLRGYLDSVPVVGLFRLHDSLLSLRKTLETVKERWYQERIADDSSSVGRRLRVELWELRYPGWLIQDILASLGSSLLTIEMERVLEEVVTARFPALKHVPDTVRADVLITFGRTETMGRLLLTMERLIPIYARRGGRLSATPSAVICPSFISPADFCRPPAEWSVTDEDKWERMQRQLIDARNGAVRRILEAPGYSPRDAPW